MRLPLSCPSLRSLTRGPQQLSESRLRLPLFHTCYIQLHECCYIQLHECWVIGQQSSSERPGPIRYKGRVYASLDLVTDFIPCRYSRESQGEPVDVTLDAEPGNGVMA